MQKDHFRTLIIPVLIIFLAAVFSPPSVLAQSEDGYLWPAKGRIEVTGVFCDPRSGHPHGGIDISHFGKVGSVPIVSVEKGLLMRIRSSEYGYGNAVYILMPGGKVAVYAHLDRFSNRLQNVATEIRRKTGLLRLDYYYEPDEMIAAVAKGEIIGYGGKSGTSTAHLHFEIRQDDLVNLNPLTNGFAIIDTVAPNIRGVMLRPVDLKSRINGRGRAKAWSKSAVAKAGPLRVKGRVGLSADVTDQNRKGGRRYHPYAMKIFVDRQPYFETRYEKWGYIDQNVWLTQYDEAPGGKKYMRVYNPFPVEIPFFSSADKGTFHDLSPGAHHVELVAADAVGLEDRVEFSIFVEEDSDSAKRPWPRGQGAHELFNDRVVDVNEGAFALVGYEYSFFEPVLVDIQSDSASPDACYNVSDPGVRLRRKIGVRFRYDAKDENPKRLGVFFMDGARAKFLGAAHDPAHRFISADGDAFGRFCLLRDDTSPSIENVRVAKGASPSISFHARDDLSGFSRDSVRVFVDGRLALVDFRPRLGAAKAEVYWKLDPGEHVALIETTDRLGNKARHSHSFFK
jgi:hypothetical protein